MARWQKPPIDKNRVLGISERFGLDLLTSTILVRRGLDSPEELSFFMERHLRYLHNPFLFEDMPLAVERVIQAKEEGERILVFGDRDADGISSTVLLTEFLEEMGMEVDWRVPMGDEQYGLSLDAVEEHARNGGSLIITVDCGISSVREITRAAELGLDVIVLDHHEPKEELPPAYAIIDPKVEGSGYPFRDLAGCGVVAKFLWALTFGLSDHFNQEVSLLNIRPGNEAYIVEVIQTENLIELDRVQESIVPGMVPVDRTRIYDLIAQSPIYVYDLPLQQRLFQAAFGRGVELQAFDLKPLVERLYPSLKGRSLLRLKDRSRGALYREKPPEEIDVLFSLFQAVLMEETGVLRSMERVMDLVGLGTLADLMPLRNENRILVREGLVRLSDPERPGLRALMARQKLLGKKLAPRDVLWQVGPIINASGRMGSPDVAVRLLLCRDPAEAEALGDELIKLNDERKRLGEDLWQRIQPQAYESFTRFKEKFVLVYHDAVQRGVTGILAARLAQKFKVPAAILAPLEEEGRLVGSLRSFQGVGVLNLLTACEDLLMEYGGHDFAAGFSLHPERLEEFIERLVEVVEDLGLPLRGEEPLTIDAEIPPSWMTPDIMKVVEFFAPYGEQNPPLRLLYREAVVRDIQFIGRNGQPHIKFHLAMGGALWPAVYWGASDKVNVEFSEDDEVDVVFTPTWNTYQNQETIQLTVVDMRRCEGS
ncbi:single-stranded-DNA-specific exonuclease RecJ [Spirochaeta thermophila]|uniref:Single-stranded-DNA-specific exonuclease RecJ n=1 Tax=Winmispira thermophila (strain ATCC 49972 / DSM 6192 / RI 19.B1) TaxID=665571 RepID=E0RR34_WINT6|nr:single-stranded-DNA-specific exonuclease RecJ [Spirochaeta thermophila]ADN01612.1 single-stranded-DNA-specific exonuclease [Spirochaeta thermophila DSM 6192]